jgi:periplasmic protein TonB
MSKQQSYFGSTIPRSGATGSGSSAMINRRYRDYERRADVTVRSWHRSQNLFPTIEVWGNYNNYRSAGLKGSAIFHVVLIGLLLASASFGHHIVEQAKPREVVTLIAPSPETYTLPTAKKEISGGGGGGDRDPLPAPKGELPKLDVQQITPPQIVLRNQKPKLAVKPTVVVPPQVQVASNHMPNLGSPAAAPLPAAPPSNGVGAGGGIGSGSGGGVGVGYGPGVGAGTGGGMGGGVYKVGGGISAPKPLATPDPEYTDEARRAKIQGTCILWLIVGADGRPRDIKVVRGLGYGLDAKALETVKQWKFEPAQKDGTPVNVQVSVEVIFRLF